MTLREIYKYLPNSLRYGQIKCRGFDKSLEAYFDRLERLNNLNYQSITPLCIFDWVVLAELGNVKSKFFLDFIDKQITHSFKQIDKGFHDKLKSTVKNLILTVHTTVEQFKNPEYLNYIAEILAINQIQSNKRYTLVDIERKLPNGKRVDFVFKDNDEGIIFCVDVLSIHNIDCNKTQEDLSHFLLNRFNQKLEEKTIGLKEERNKIKFGKKDYVPFSIWPFIWTEPKKIVKYLDVFKKVELKYANVMPCSSILTERIDNNEYVFSVCSISHILESAR